MLPGLDALPLRRDWLKLFRRAAKGAVIDRGYAEYVASAALTSQIPPDDTIPQVTEGTQILTLSFSMKSVTNRLRLRFQGEAACDAGPLNLIAAVFSSASSSAIAAVAVITHAANENVMMCVEHEYLPATTAPLTFTVRVGPQSGTMRMNGNSVSRLLGGVAKCTLVVEEIAA